jgi:hypothetical protein
MSIGWVIGWVVIVGAGSFSSCYGLFDTYDDAVTWLRVNGWTPADCDVRPVQSVEEK